MSALTRRSFLQSGAVVAGAAAVVGPAARAMATDSSSTSSSTTPSSTPPSSAASKPAGDVSPPSPPVGDPIIAYVNGSTVTVLSGEREVTVKDDDLARRITRAAKSDG